MDIHLLYRVLRKTDMVRFFSLIFSFLTAHLNDLNKVTGGPIKEHKYQFLQFHMHWGQGNLI